jgi:hypothetical protein
LPQEPERLELVGSIQGPLHKEFERFELLPEDFEFDNREFDDYLPIN